MMFLNPGGAWLLPFIPLFAWLIRLSLRFRRQSAPSLFLLAEEIDSLPILSSTVLRRRKFRFFLLLAAVSAVALSALMPVVGSPADPADALIIVDHRARRVDADGVERGWDSVVEKVGGIIDSLGGRDRAMIVISDRGPVTNGFVTPRKALRALRNASPSDLPSEEKADGSLVDILRLLEPDLGYIVSPFPSLWRSLTSRAALPWHIVPAGVPSSPVNLALLNVEVQPDFLRRGVYSIFCRFSGYSFASTGGIQAHLNVQVDQATVASREVLIENGRDSMLVLEDLSLPSGLLTVSLSPGDAFMQDNVFRMPLRSVPSHNVNLYTTGNPALEAALKAVGGITVTTLSPEAKDLASDTPVAVFDGPVPEDIRSSALFVRPFSMPAGMEQRGEASYASRIDMDRNDPLLAGVSFTGLRPGRIPVIVPPPSMRVLARADGSPLVVAGRLPSGHRMALISFDPVATGWIYTPEFPILVANLISWLSLDTRSTASSFTVGDVVDRNLFSSDGILTGPDGSSTSLGTSVEGGYMFTRAGVYAYRGPDAEGSVFVNHLDESFSRLIAAAGVHDDSRKSVPLPRRPFSLPLARILLITGLVLLVIEPLSAPRAAVGRLR